MLREITGIGAVRTITVFNENPIDDYIENKVFKRNLSFWLEDTNNFHGKIQMGFFYNTYWS